MIRKKPITGGRFKTEFAYHRSTFLRFQDMKLDGSNATQRRARVILPLRTVIVCLPCAWPSDVAPMAPAGSLSLRRLRLSWGRTLTDGDGGSLWAPPIVGTDDPGILGLTAHACETLAVRFLHPEQQHSFSCHGIFCNRRQRG